MTRTSILILTLLLTLTCSYQTKAQCSGTPPSGTINSTTSASCSAFSSVLSLSGAGSGPGITYQWSSSPDGITFAPIGGATNSTYNASVTATTYFHCTVTCTTTSASTTTPDIALTVNTVAPITGITNVCAGYSNNLHDATPGGTWSSSNPSVVPINPTTGVVTGISVGTAIITYTSPAGCIAVGGMGVDALPASIGGTQNVCVGSVTLLTNATPGGSWSSSDPSIGNISPTSGYVSGLSAGTVTITYALVTGCYNLAQVTVNPLPAPITGTASVCEGQTTSLHDITPGGAWSSDVPGTANVGVLSGLVTGYTAGTTTISYTIVLTGCGVSEVVTVNPTPTTISGTTAICFGDSATLGNTVPGGTWSSSDPTVATIGSTSGIVHTFTTGTSTISYHIAATGCSNSTIITVNPLPSVYNVTGGGSYCAGGTGVSVGLNGSDIGISYALYYGTSATGFIPGTGAPIDFGLLTVAGTYTVNATNAATGCKIAMADSAVVVITPLVTPTVTIVSSAGDTLCPGTTTISSADTTYAGSAPTYLWSVNGLAIATSPTYSFVPLDGDVIKVVMVSNAQCASPDTVTDSLLFTVLSNMTPSVSVSVVPGDTVCQYNGAAFTAIPSFGGHTPEYIWTVNGSAAAVSGPVFNYIPVNHDIVICKLISNYQCRLADTVASSPISMTVQPLTIPHVVIMASPGMVADSGSTVTLTAVTTGAGPAPTYKWFLNGTIVPGATASTFAYVFSDEDSISCVVTSSGVCNGISSYDWIFLTFTPPPIGVIAHTASIADIKLSPNPNKGSFYIKGTLGTITDEEVTYEITNMLGQIVYTNKLTARTGRVNEHIEQTQLSNGMYLLTLRTAGDSKTFHFVVEQ